MGFVSQLGQELVVQEIKKYLPGGISGSSQNYVLSLGSVNFAIDDLPSEIKLGGTQALGVHQYPGGGLDVQTLGAFDDPISWSAIFTYSGAPTGSLAASLASVLIPSSASTSSTATAITRALQVNAMRVQGSSVKLKIGTMSQNVIISKFSFRYVNDHYVPYDIELQPVASMSVQSATTSTSLLSTALQAALSGVSVSSIVKNAAGQALTNVTTAAVSTTLANILQAKATGNPSLSVVGVALAATTQTTHIVGSGESLYSIAQSIYGDGTKWPTIASANSISNPLSIAIGQKIIIPSQTGS